MKIQQAVLICDLCGQTILTMGGMSGKEFEHRASMGRYAMIDDLHEYQHWPIDPMVNNGRDHLDVCRGCCSTLKSAVSFGITEVDIELLKGRYTNKGNE